VGVALDVGQTEVGDVQVPVGTEDQIVRLDVPVQNPIRMSMSQSISDFRHQPREETKIVPGSLVSPGLVVSLRRFRRHREFGRRFPIGGELPCHIA